MHERDETRRRTIAETFWTPSSIALLGVSRKPEAVTARPAHYVTQLGFQGEVAVVHPGAAGAGESTLHGHRVVADLAELEHAPDVAMVMVPAASVAAALRECAEAGVSGAVVIASGFEGTDAQTARRGLHAVLQDFPHFRVVGPNSVGSLSTVSGAALTFSSVLGMEPVHPGSVGLVTQSGALGNGLLLGLQSRGAGVSQWVSTGDEIDLGALEATAAMLQESATKVVGLFLEGIGDGHLRPELEDAIKSSGKRVVALKSARSAAGRAAAVGHTGRVVGNGEIAVAALREIGVELVSSLDELLEVTTALNVAPAPPLEGPARVAVITVSGGAGVLAADEVHDFPQLSLATFDDELVARVSALLPDYVHVANPLDVPVIDDASTFEDVLAEIAKAQGIDATIAIASTLAHDYDSLSSRLSDDGTMRIITHLGPTEGFTREQAERLSASGVAALQSPIHAVRALAAWAGSGLAASEEPVGAEHGEPTAGDTAGYARAADRLKVPAEHLPAIAIVRSAQEAIDFAARAGRIVLKAEGSAIAHRSELGAVKVGLEGEAEVSEAYTTVAEICAMHGDEVLAQGMAAGGTEVMVSILRDPEIGLVALLRLGGIFVELGNESVVLTQQRQHWRRALAGSTLGRVLDGFRGDAAADMDALLDVVEHLMTAVAGDPEVAAVEANPVIVRPLQEGGGAIVVDLAALVHAK